MLKYHLLLFVRKMRRQKLFAFINLLGLSVGMASALLVYLFVQHELTYDRFHQHANRICRVNQTFIWGEGNDHQFSSTGPGVAFALEAEVPEVEQVVRIHTPGDFLVSYTDARGKITSIDQGKILAADSNFFDVFTFPLLRGNPQTALRHPQTLVVTASTAKKYFGDDDPIGKLLRLGEGDQQQTYEVTGVVRDLPDNSYIQFDMMLSMTSFPIVRRLSWSWVWTQVETFVLLKPGSSIDQARARLNDIPRKYAATTLERAMNMSYDDYIRSGKEWNLYLQPLTKIHLPEAAVYNRLNDSGNAKIVYALIGAGLVMILLSCINFMNLSTAQYARTAKATALRKLLGSARRQLSAAFFTEAFLFCLIALVVGIGLTQLILPAFNLVSGKNLQLHLTSDWALVGAMGALLLLMSLLCGSYPAAFLSAFNPVAALKGQLKSGKEGKALRGGLVVFQFMVSMALIIFTGVVGQQLKFVAEKDLGFDRENLLVIARAEWANGTTAFSHALETLPGVISVSECSSVPPQIYGGDKFQAEGNPKTVPLNFARGDENYLPTLGVQLKYGRNFSKDIPADSARVILNETAVKAFGWAADASVIGKKVSYPGDDQTKFEVIGVTDDFHFWSLDAPVEPFGFFHIKNPLSEGRNRTFVVVRMNGENRQGWENTITQINAKWKTFAGDKPFQYSFVDQAFANAFKSTDRFGKSLTVLSGIALLIAGLGLLGMIIYTLEQRTKEIGIRKVVGASVWNIMVLISREYSRLVVIAFVISVPVAWWLVTQWLRDFEYRIVPSPIIFVLAGVGTFVLAALITGYHALRASQTNPVDVLKDE